MNLPARDMTVPHSTQSAPKTASPRGSSSGNTKNASGIHCPFSVLFTFLLPHPLPEQCPHRGQPMHPAPLFFFLRRQSTAVPTITMRIPVTIKLSTAAPFRYLSCISFPCRHLFPSIFCPEPLIRSMNQPPHNAGHCKQYNQSRKESVSKFPGRNQCTNLVNQKGDRITGTELEGNPSPEPLTALHFRSHGSECRKAGRCE